MEEFFTGNPYATISFYKKAIPLSLFFGTITTTPALFCISQSWNSVNTCDFVLRIYHLVRIFLFLVHVCIRIKIWKTLNHVQQGGERNEVVRRLRFMLQTRLWRINNYLNNMVSVLFLFITIFSFFWRTSSCAESNSGLYELGLFNIVMSILSISMSYKWIRQFILEDNYEAAIRQCGTTQENIESNSRLLSIPELNTNSRFASDNCQICISDYKETCQIRLLQCAHHFHKDCIDNWLRKKKICPLCLVPIDEKPKNEDPEHKE